jgi:hypothetical protein
VVDGGFRQGSASNRSPSELDSRSGQVAGVTRWGTVVLVVETTFLLGRAKIRLCESLLEPRAGVERGSKVWVQSGHKSHVEGSWSLQAVGHRPSNKAVTARS